jgi:hypothetical protein
MSLNPRDYMNAPPTEAEAYEALRLAQLHTRQGAMQSSAELCAADALECFNAGDYGHAHERAVKSLAYSVGIFSPVYKAAVFPTLDGSECPVCRGWNCTQANPHLAWIRGTHQNVATRSVEGT